MGLTAAFALIYMTLMMVLAKLLIRSFRLREPEELVERDGEPAWPRRSRRPS